LARPAPAQVRMRNTAVAVNYRDILMRRGVHVVKSLPSGIGLESAGVIEAVGPGVEGFSVGDRVAFAGMPEGSYAELRIVSPQPRLIALPARIDERTAASMMIRGMTARSLLFDAYKVQPGDTIVIHAAAGGVGLIMLPMWRSIERATVIGTGAAMTRPRSRSAHGCRSCHRLHPGRLCRARPRDHRRRRWCPWSTIRWDKGDLRGDRCDASRRRGGDGHRSAKSVGRSRSGAATTPRSAGLDLSHSSSVSNYTLTRAELLATAI